MKSNTKLRARLCCALILISFFFGVTSGTEIGWAQRRIGEAVPSAWQNDAELTDITFVDAQHGWAVGEHGTLLRTIDGGATWELSSTELALSPQQSMVTGEMRRLIDNVRSNIGESNQQITQTVRQSLDIRLESVSFANANLGIAVGGQFEPYTQLSRGHVLKTTDGGATWTEVKGTMLPKLNRLQLNGPWGSWAVGHHAFLHNSGVFTTYDNGQAWGTTSLGHLGHWQDAARTATGWVLVDTDGRLFSATETTIRPAVMVGCDTARLRRVLMENDQSGWAVGEQGAIVRTEDGGETWFVPQFIHQHPGLEHFDFRALAVSGDHVWIAGSPGTRVFQIDRARSIRSQATSTNIKINALTFFDTQLGWAVGSHGSILHTVDGGENWVRQRGEHSGVSLLTIGLDSDNTALEALCKCSTSDGYLAANVRIDLTGNPSSLGPVTHAAARLGAIESRHWAFDLRSSFRFGDAERKPIVAQLVRLIRELEPRVIVADAQATRLASGAYIDTFLLLDEAIKLAADAQAFPDHLEATGLKPWQVDRIAVPMATGSGQWRLDQTTYLPRIGKLIDDETALCRAIINQPLAMPGDINHRVVSYTSMPGDLGANLFVGLAELGRPLPRRDELAMRRGNLQDVNNTMQKKDVIRALADMNLYTAADQIIWEQNLVQWLQWVDREAAGVWLAQLAEAYHAQGKLRAALLTLDHLAIQYPDHPLTPVILATMAHFVSSQEARIAAREPSQASPSNSPSENAPALDRNTLANNTAKSMEIDWLPLDSQLTDSAHAALAAEAVTAGETIVDTQVAMASAESELLDIAEKENPHRADWQAAYDQLTRLRQRDPELAAHPDIRSLEAHVLRNAESWKEAANQYRQLALHNNLDLKTRLWAVNEIEFQQQVAPPREHTLDCQWLSAKPLLDGDLNDPVWQNMLERGHAKMLKMTPLNPNEAARTDFMLWGYDAEYLYVAVRCTKLSGINYLETAKTRSRNPELDNSDRVLISLDLDRDGGWPLQLAFNSRGEVGDGCGTSTRWDPQWFVAAQQTETHWMIEAALPWKELDIPCPPADSIWNAGITRRPPRRLENVWDTRVPAQQYATSTRLLGFPVIADTQYLRLVFSSSESADQDR